MTAKGDTLAYLTDTESLVLNSRHFYRFKNVVCGSKFTMGKLENSDLEPTETQRVILSGYLIGTEEVPQWLWNVIMDSNDSAVIGEELPVTNISWEDCVTFLKRLNKLMGVNWFKLPTEAQWEFAARGGLSTHHYRYSGADTPDAHLIYRDNSNGEIRRSSECFPNELGIYAMSGNVQEWCQDSYAPYSGGAVLTDPCQTEGTDKVVRGGHYDDPAESLLVTRRNHVPRGDRSETLGFRLISDRF